MDNALVLTPSTAARTTVRGVGTGLVPGPASVHPIRPVYDIWPRSVAPSFERDVLTGLAQARKTIPSTWLYDHRGSELFEQITRLEEYYQGQRALLSSTPSVWPVRGYLSASFGNRVDLEIVKKSPVRQPSRRGRLGSCQYPEARSRLPRGH